MIRSVVFDVGETLIDDTREWARWADWLNVPLHTFSAVLGAVTAEGRNNAETFDYFRPGFDLAEQRQQREDAGRGELIEEVDLYSDVRPGLQALRDAGLWVGIAGNQTSRAGELLQQLNLPVEAIATSGEWGVAKPDPGFFDRVIALLLVIGEHDLVRDPELGEDRVALRAARRQDQRRRRGDAHAGFRAFQIDSDGHRRAQSRSDSSQ
jgi:N-acetyl-D-muramate 6-phosphate phosphatase